MSLLKKWSVILFRDRIMSSWMPGMTAAEAFEAEPSSFQGAMGAKSVQHIIRARGIKPTGVSQEGRNSQLIEANEKGKKQSDHRIRIKQ
jgi:hypothetical protein